jgi:hypothetical protein
MVSVAATQASKLLDELESLLLLSASADSAPASTSAAGTKKKNMRNNVDNEKCMELVHQIEQQLAELPKSDNNEKQRLLQRLATLQTQLEPSKSKENSAINRCIERDEVEARLKAVDAV